MRLALARVGSVQIIRAVLNGHEPGRHRAGNNNDLRLVLNKDAIRATMRKEAITVGLS